MAVLLVDGKILWHHPTSKQLLSLFLTLTPCPCQPPYGLKSSLECGHVIIDVWNKSKIIRWFLYNVLSNNIHYNAMSGKLQMDTHQILIRYIMGTVALKFSYILVIIHSININIQFQHWILYLTIIVSSTLTIYLRL